MRSYLVYQTLNIIFCVLVYMQYNASVLVSSRTRIKRTLLRPFVIVRACGIPEYFMCIFLDNEENFSHCIGKPQPKRLDCSSLQGNMVELTETCPNQDVINYRKLIENCPK